MSAQLRASVLQVHQMQTALATLQEKVLGKANQDGRENGHIGRLPSESVWDEKGIHGESRNQGLNGFRGVTGGYGVNGDERVNGYKDARNPTRFAEGLAPRTRFRAGVWAVVAHLRLLSLGRFSVNQTVTKLCRESVPLLPRGSVRLDRELLLAVAEAGAGSSPRQEAEAVVKLLDTAQKRWVECELPCLTPCFPSFKKHIFAAEIVRTALFENEDSRRQLAKVSVASRELRGLSFATSHPRKRRHETLQLLPTALLQ